jgi:hypothetical protein
VELAPKFAAPSAVAERGGTLDIEPLIPQCLAPPHRSVANAAAFLVGNPRHKPEAVVALGRAGVDALANRVPPDAGPHETAHGVDAEHEVSTPTVDERYENQIAGGGGIPEALELLPLFELLFAGALDLNVELRLGVVALSAEAGDRFLLRLEAGAVATLLSSRDAGVTEDS